MLIGDGPAHDGRDCTSDPRAWVEEQKGMSTDQAAMHREELAPQQSE
jgi:hypothetical protein